MGNNEPTGRDKSEGKKIDRRTYLQIAGVSGVGITVGGIGPKATRSRLTDEPPAGRGERYREEEIIVGVSNDVDKIVPVVRGHLPAAAEIVHKNETLRYVAVRLPSDAKIPSHGTFISSITERPHVDYAEPNRRFNIQFSPDDPLFSDQEAITQVNAPNAWDVSSGSDVTIAVVDQGVKYDHPDLSANVSSSPGYDVINDTFDPYPADLSKEFHGTHVAGIAAAVTDNATGIAGVSEATIRSYRVANANGEAYMSDFADGIERAVDDGADVINVSLGGGGPDSLLKNAVSYADDNGALVVAAAGNDFGNSVVYPAAYEECVAVSALDEGGSMADFSSTGSEVELCAPGSEVLSTETTDGYGTWSGTSMAAPIVSGVAALVLSRWSVTNEQLREHLRNTATDIGLGAHKQGSGRVDAYRAVTTEPDISSSGEEIIDGFEDGDLSEYDTDRGAGHSIIRSPVADGSYALELADNTTTEIISTTGLSTYPQAGDTFTVRFRTNGTGGGEQANFTYGVQDHQNRYFVQLHPGQQTMRLFRYEDDQSVILSDRVSAQFTANEWHVLEIDWRTNGTHVVTLYEEDGATRLARCSGTDTTWTSGGIGFDAYLSSGEAVYFDDVRMQPTDTAVVDDFEDGNLNEYEVDRGSGHRIITSPAFGSYALELADNTTTEIISTTGLSTYPQAGDTFTVRFRTNGTGGGEQANFTYGVQDHQNRYFVQLHPGQQTMRLFRYEDDTSTALTYDVETEFTPDSWHLLKIEWMIDGTHKVTLYEEDGVTVISQLSATDTTWTDGGIGFDAYVNDGEAVYFDDLVVTAPGGDNPPLVDGFEDGNFDEYQTDGATNWEVTALRSYSEPHSLSNDSNAEVLYTNEFTYERGETLTVRTYLGTENDVKSGLELWFCTNSDATQKYVQYVSAENNDHYIVYRDGNKQEVIAYDADVNIPSEDWLRFEVHSTDSRIESRVFDSSGNLVSTLSGSDSQLSSGGYGFRDEWQSQDSRVFIDDVRIG